MKTILVTGSSGFIGQYLTKQFGKKYKIIGVDINDSGSKLCDLFYKSNIQNHKNISNIFNNQIDYVIHTAAEKDLRTCEGNRFEVYNSNYLSTMFLSELSKKNGSKFIYISSDIVFNGKNKNSNENTKKEPINYYGYIKSLVEDSLINDEKTAICRTAMVFDKIPLNQRGFFDTIKENNFLVVQGYIVEHVVSRLKHSEKINLAIDEFCNPTSNNLLFRQLQKVIDYDLSGVLHCCGGERISKYEFGKKIADVFELNPDLVIAFNSRDSLRPKDVSLDILLTQEKMQMTFDDITSMLLSFKERVCDAS